MESKMHMNEVLRVTAHSAAAAAIGAIVFGAGVSYGVTPLDLPAKAIIAVEGGCPKGWRQVDEGRVIVGAGTNIPASGGNMALLADGGVSIAEGNIPQLSTNVSLSGAVSTSISVMPISSGANGSFFARELYNNNSDVFLYGYTTYHGKQYDGLSSNSLNTSSPVSFGHATPARLDVAMPYVSHSLCQRV
jgi:hypothetical protein